VRKESISVQTNPIDIFKTPRVLLRVFTELNLNVTLGEKPRGKNCNRK
jgi:hypothetical protein